MPDSWLKAGAQTTPNPIRVSTVAVTEYGRIDLYIGTSKPPNVPWPIECCRFRIKIPTGRQDTDLTTVGAFINASATPTTGRRWRIERNTTHPDITVLDVIPDSDYAAFDGKWRLGITLAGIETNTSPGTANITIEEETRKPGETSFTTRTGTILVPKHQDDAQTFYFHSLRPANTVITRDTRVQLNWEGSSNATYTVYYRDKNGTDQARELTNPGGTWDSQARHGDTFTDATNFTVKASLDGRDLYQTTHVRVANPDISVRQLAVTDKVTTDLQVDYTKELRIRKLSGDGSPITVSDSLDQSATTNAYIKTGSGGLTANGAATIHGALTANNDVTVEGTLTTSGTLKASGIADIVGAPQHFGLSSTGSELYFSTKTSGLAIATMHCYYNRTPATASVRVYNSQGNVGNTAMQDRHTTASYLVGKDKHFAARITYSHLNQAGAEGSVAWIPFGLGEIPLTEATAITPGEPSDKLDG